MLRKVTATALVALMLSTFSQFAAAQLSPASTAPAPISPALSTPIETPTPIEVTAVSAPSSQDTFLVDTLNLTILDLDADRIASELGIVDQHDSSSTSGQSDLTLTDSPADPPKDMKGGLSDEQLKWLKALVDKRKTALLGAITAIKDDKFSISFYQDDKGKKEFEDPDVKWGKDQVPAKYNVIIFQLVPKGAKDPIPVIVRLYDADLSDVPLAMLKEKSERDAKLIAKEDQLFRVQVGEKEFKRITPLELVALLSTLRDGPKP